MLFKLSRKVEGGKLLTVDVECDAAAIRSVKLTGDFFLHPEDTLSSVEESLRDLPRNSSALLVEQRITQALDANEAQFIGVNPRDIAATILDACKIDSGDSRA